MFDDFGWPAYVPVAERRRKALKKMESLRKKGRDISPVSIEGRTIAKSFWGKAWCENLESYSDYENRMPRGRTYVRNGSVVDLQIAASKITALDPALAGARTAGWLLQVGILIFCGTLYAMALGAPRWFGAITPIGGIALIVGWAWLACVALKVNG